MWGVAVGGLRRGVLLWRVVAVLRGVAVGCLWGGGELLLRRGVLRWVSGWYGDWGGGVWEDLLGILAERRRGDSPGSSPAERGDRVAAWWAGSRVAAGRVNSRLAGRTRVVVSQ